MKIDLNSELTFRNAYLFPLQSKRSRTEIFIGGIWVLVPFIGWILNMGHRIILVHRMQSNEEPWPAWGNLRELFRHGFITLLGMIYYYSPGFVLLEIGHIQGSPAVAIVGVVLIILATIAIPGFMSHYCKEFDAREIFNPIKALKRVFEGGAAYWKAWAIALSALGLSFLGLLFFGIGFLFTSVWFWQVAGWSFANVFTKKFRLGR